MTQDLATTITMTPELRHRMLTGYLRHAARRPSNIALIVFLTVVVVTGLALSILIRDAFLAVLAGALLVAVLCIGWLVRRRTATSLRTAHPDGSECAVTVSEDGLALRSALADQHSQWAAWKRITVRDDVVIVRTEGNALDALLPPGSLPPAGLEIARSHIDVR